MGSRTERLRFKLQFLSYLDVFWVHLQYSAAIPMAYNLAVDLGLGMTYSGLLIGSFWGAVAFGSLLVAKPFVSQARQSVQRICGLCAMFALVVFNLAYVTGANPPDSWSWTQDHRALLVLGSRVGSGFAWSIATMVVSCMAVKVTPKTEQVKVEGIRSFFITLGIGCGPLLAVAYSVTPSGQGVVHYTRNQIAFPAWVSCAVGAGVLLFAWRVIPDSEELIDQARVTEAVGRTTAPSKDSIRCAEAAVLGQLAPERAGRAWWKPVVYVVGCLYGVERALLTSSLESATALVLQTYFGWSPYEIGRTVGLIFVGAACLILGMVSLRPILGDGVLIKLGSTICILSSLLLFWGVNSDPRLLILADVLIFTAGFVASSVAEGMAMTCATSGTWYSVENAWLIRNVLKCNVSRFLGPVLARLAVATDGGQLYATSQVVLSALACIFCGFLTIAAWKASDEASDSTEGVVATRENHSVEKAPDSSRDSETDFKSIERVSEDSASTLSTEDSPSKKYRLGICGLGRVANYYLENLSETFLDRFELVAGVDPDTSTWQKLPKGVSTGTDFTDLLSLDLDCVVILAPTAAHFTLASQAIVAGLPVLLEKPATTSLQQLEHLCGLCQEKQVLQIAMHGCYSDEVLWMAARKDNYGALLDLEAWFFDPYVFESKVVPQAESLCGSWLDSGANAISSLIVALGQEVVVDSIEQEWVPHALDVIEVATVASVRVGQAQGIVRTDWRRGVSDKGIRLRFEHASVTLQHTQQRVIVDGQLVEDFSANPRMPTRYNKVLDAFARALATSRDNREFALPVHRSMFSHMKGKSNATNVMDGTGGGKGFGGR
jgi:predicted dehydrogenase